MLKLMFLWKKLLVFFNNIVFVSKEFGIMCVVLEVEGNIILIKK